MQNIVIEEELLIRFSTNESESIEKAWIEGESMYMGKIPVMLESRGYNDATKIGVTFLGSCTQAKMIWRLYVQTKSVTTAKTQIFSVIFESTSD